MERFFDQHVTAPTLDGGLPIYDWPESFPVQQSRLLPGIIEWMYTNKVPKVDRDSCWLCLGLLRTLGLAMLENIIFQYVDQRVNQFRDHFPQDTWIWYLSQTAQYRPDFAPVVLKTAFVDVGATSPITQYEFAKKVILYQQQRGVPLTEYQSGRIMDAVEFDRMDTERLTSIALEDLVPQAQMAFYGRQQAEATEMTSKLDQKLNSKNEKQDSAVEISERQLTMMDSPQMETRASDDSLPSQPQDREDHHIQQLREQLESTIGQEPLLILSPVTDSHIDSNVDTPSGICAIAPRAADRFLSTEDILQQVGQRLHNLSQEEDIPLSALQSSSTTLRDTAQKPVAAPPIRQPEMLQKNIPIRRESLILGKDGNSVLSSITTAVPIAIPGQRKSMIEPVAAPPPSLSSTRPPPPQHQQEQPKRVGFSLRTSRSREMNDHPLGQSSVASKSGMFRPRQSPLLSQPPQSYMQRTGPTETVSSYNYNHMPQNRQRSMTSQPSVVDPSLSAQGPFVIGQSPQMAAPREMHGTSSLNGSRSDLRSSHSMYNLNFDASIGPQTDGDLENMGFSYRKKPSGFFDLIKGLF